MPIIGSGPGIASGVILETGAARAVGSSGPGTLTPNMAQTGAPAQTAVATNSALHAGGVPVDQDRVATIRQAIEANTYPVVPTKIGDAMIAAGMLLRMPRK